MGNFGDGTIDAFNPTNGNFISALDDPNGNPLAIDGLWGLSFGNGAHGQGVDTLYFTAGIAGPDTVEAHGLFGSLTAVPEPQGIALGGLGLAALLLFINRRRLGTADNRLQ